MEGNGEINEETEVKTQSTNTEESVARLKLISGQSPFKIIGFDPEEGMEIIAWLKYFNHKCLENRKNESWKISDIGEFLKGKALKEYINSCLGIENWEELTQILCEKFFESNTVTFGEFSQCRLHNPQELTQYFKNKIAVGRKLQLNTDIIIQGLTDGLPANLRQLMAIQPPVTPTEWLNLATKLIKNQDRTTESRQNVNVGQNVRPQQYQFRPRTFQNYRQWVPPQQNSYRFQGPNLNRNRPPMHNVHFQSPIPSRACRLCAQQGITNAYHWEQNCIFRQPEEVNARVTTQSVSHAGNQPEPNNQ